MLLSYEAMAIFGEIAHIEVVTDSLRSKTVFTLILRDKLMGNKSVNNEKLLFITMFGIKAIKPPQVIKGDK